MGLKEGMMSLLSRLTNGLDMKRVGMIIDKH